MSDKIGFFSGKIRRLILSNWLILSSLLLIIVSVNCAGSRSVRSGGIYTHSATDKETKEIKETKETKETIQNPKNDNISKAIEEYENRIKSKKSPETKLVASVESKDVPEDNDLKTSNEPRLPTLREQMQTLADGQKTINKRIDTVNKDIYEIKALLKDIQGSVDLMYDSQKRTPETGVIKPDPKKVETNIPKKEKSDYIILPDDKDEKVKDTPKKLNKDELKKRAIAETFSDNGQHKSNKTQKKDIVKNTVKKTAVISSKTPKKSEEVKNKETKSQDVSITISDSVKAGINEFRSANYSKAINILTNTIKDETSLKNLSEIHFYIAESYFAIRDFRNSITYYTKVLDYRDSPYKPKAQLKIAESNMRSGRIPEAKIAYEKLIQNYPESEYVPQARKMLQQL